MKKLLYLLLIFSIPAYAVQYKYVQIPASGGASLQAGTTTGFFVSSGTILNGTIPNLMGTTTNDTACSGCVGQFISSTTAAATNIASASGNFIRILSTTVIPGDYLISGNSRWLGNSAGTSQIEIAVSNYDGNSTTDHSDGYNVSTSSGPQSGVYGQSISIPAWHFQTATSTIVYLKVMAQFTSGTPQVSGASLGVLRIR